MHRIVVTGGSGFIGTNLVDRLRADGRDVRNLDLVAPRNAAHADVWTKVDLLDRAELIEVLASWRPQAVVHLAARTDLDEDRDVGGYAANIDGMLHLAEAIRLVGSVERLIVASTQLVCELGHRPRDEFDVGPTTVYGRSKVLTERIVRATGGGAATWTIVRPTTVWGPWFDAPLRELFLLLARGRYVHPAQIGVRKQWGFVGNVVHQLRALIDADAAVVHGRTLYVADEEPVELGDFIDRVGRALGGREAPRVAKRVLEAAAAAGDLAQRAGWSRPPLTRFRYRNIVTDEIQDVSPVSSIAGRSPYGIDESIELTVRWMRDLGLLPVPSGPARR